MTRFALWRKIIAQLLMLTLLAELAPVALFAAEGPATPEAAQFEPVDATDLVNLYTGDFVYNTPLLEVPGPEGSWPVSMSYHAGVGPNTEATWVGLGWTLNPGAINRFVSGYPDDYYGGGMYSTFGAQGKGKGFNAGISIAVGPASAGLSYNSQQGFGYNLGLSLTSMVGLDGPIDVGANYGSSGASIGVSLSKAGNVGTAAQNFGASIGADLNSKGKTSAYGSAGFQSRNDRGRAVGGFTGVSFSSQGGTSFSAGGLGISSQTVSSRNMKMHLTHYGISIKIPVEAVTIGLSLGYFEQEWWIKQIDSDRGIGTIHQRLYRNYWEFKEATINDIWGEGSDNVIDDFVIDAEESTVKRLVQSPTIVKQLGNKIERSVLDNDIIIASEDLYSVNVQGLNGTFRPYFEYGYTLEDDEDDRFGILTVQGESEVNYGPYIKFRMEGDPGGNFIAKQGTYLDFGRIGNSGAQYGSKKILPAIDKETGKIVGFKIVAEDGKTYEFYRPVYSYMEYTYNEKNQNDLNSQTITISPYATSWLLTGVKGPDYVDRGVPGMSSDDYGFWVRFTYQENDNFVLWRTPHNGYVLSKDEGGNSNKDTRSYNTGVKEKVYLETIETATHLLKFDKSDRDDDLPAFGYKDFLPNNNPTDFKGNTILLGAYRATSGYKSAVECTVDCGGGGGNPTIPYTRVIFDIPYKKILEVKDYATANNWVKVLYGNFQNGERLGVYEGTVGSPVLDLFKPYDADSSQCYVDYDYLSTVSWSANVSGYVFLNAWLTVPYNTTSVLKKHAKRLDQIKLYKKVLYGSSGLTDYGQTYATSVIEGSSFIYDYSLSKNSPNSNASGQGKLTLKSITKFGMNAAIYVPPTNFTYGNNPDYDRNKWDLWNGYSAAGTSTSHFNSDFEATANLDASAWNLSMIESPLGATIAVEYESDRIQYVSHATMSLLSSFSGIGNAIGSQTTFTVSDPTRIQKWLDYGYKRFLLLESQQWEDQDGYCQPLGNGVNYFTAEVEVAALNGNQVTVTQPFEFRADEQPTCGGRTYFYNYSFAPLEGFFGGGHRVKSIMITDVVAKKKTSYRYFDGATPSLPSAYKFYHSTDPILTQYPLEYRLMNKGFNVIGPSPSIGYSKVEIMEVDPESAQDVILNGKTSYEYFTSRDFQFDPTYISNVVTINDKTGIYGQVKCIKTYALSSNGFRIIKEDKRLYQFSDKLIDATATPLNGNPADQKPKWIFKSASDCVPYSNTPLGLLQQKYWTKNEGEPQKLIKHTKLTVFLVGTESITYHYDEDDNQSGILKSSVHNIAYDANSGQILTTESNDSKGDRVISEHRPAYWFYPSMKLKNMLTQFAEQRLYTIPLSVGPVAVYNPSHQCDGTIESWIKPHLKSATVTTWKDWGNGVWRQNDTYTATKTGSNYVDFSNWTAADNESTNPGNYDFPDGWRRTSNITAYDRYGHPTEERSLDGTYTSSIYGYGDALPVAIAQNAKTSEIKFYNFESSSYTSGGKTGDYSKSYSGNVAEMTTPNVPGTTFMVSGWIKPSQSTTIQGVSYPANGQWQYFEVKNVASNTAPAITSGQGQIDDIRIHPMDATMSTFTYDNLTWKVTAISDANSIITYYEYDGAGRLVKVYDQDKNLIKKHTYQYKRTN